MSLPTPLLLLNLRTPSTTIFPKLTPTTCPHFLSSQTPSKPFSPKPSSSISPQFSLHQQQYEEEEQIIGDCLVFEEGIFEDPCLEQRFNFDSNKAPKSTKLKVQAEPENLIPDKWKEAQAAFNISKKERRKIAQELEFGRKLDKKKQELRPIRDDDLEKEYVAYRDAKLTQLNPLVLDNHSFPVNETASDKNDEKFDNEKEKVNDLVSSGGRVKPRNPRLEVYGISLDDVSEFLNSGDYDPDAAASRNSKSPRKLFTKEEKVLLNRRVPELADATSGKWQPLHTLAASGEFYLLGALLKHNADINFPDKDGLTALHKATLGKKQAIFNFLLRESANPFIRDKEGATLMHYAVQTASSQMIKILLLYNVDINLQDNYGWTPLHLAVQSRRTDIVRLLLIKGADKTLKNRDGLTPLDLCLYSGRDTRTYEQIKLIKMLPKHNSSV